MFHSEEIVRNDSPEPLKIWIEPWGFQHTIPANSLIHLKAVSEIQGHLEVIDDGETLCVYGWAGSTLKIFQDNQLVDDVNIPVPDTGQLTARSLVEDIFGGPGGPYGGTA